ncbi:MAG: Fe-S cluster assembly protein SufD [Thermoplasmatota archaeon]
MSSPEAERLRAALQGPRWLKEVRSSALQVVQGAGGAAALPTLDERATHVAPAPPLPSAEELAGYRIPGFATRLVFLDGHHAPALSTHDAQRGAWVGPLSAALERDSVEANLNRHADPDELLTALNTLFVREGAVVELAPGTSLHTGIHLLFVHTGHAAPAATYPRLLVLAGAGSRCAMVEEHVSLGTAAVATTGVVEIVAAEGAHLSHTKIQRDALKADHLGSLYIRGAAESVVRSFLLSVGAHVARQEIRVQLAGAGASATLDGIFLGTGHQRVEVMTDVVHAAPRTTSRQLFKGILDGHARGRFDGTVHVRHDAPKTDAGQVNRNLLLSPDAMVDSNPQLEIDNDDVKCSHGSTVGRLSADALFFLQSRGLDADAARLILTQAFARDALARVDEPGVRAHLDGLVTAWFTGTRNLREKGWPA